MLTRFIKIQLILFTILTMIALIVLGWYYLRLPSLAGIGQYKLYADLPRSGGLYATANVTYRGTQIGKVTDVEPTEHGAKATMSIDSQLQDPGRRDRPTCTRCRRSVSSTSTWCRPDNPGQYLSPGQTDHQRHGAQRGRARRSTRPTTGLAVLPKEKIDSLLTETSQAVGGLGPGAAAAGRLDDDHRRATSRTTSPQVNDIIAQLGADPGQPGRLG